MVRDYLNESEFRDWCSIKESKLTSYRLINFLKETTIAMSIPLVIILFISICIILDGIIGDPKLAVYISLVCSFVLVLTLMFLDKLLGFSMTRIEFISCLLNKISKEVELCKTVSDKKDLLRDLKTLKRYLNYNLRMQFPNIELFRNDINKLKISINLLKILPKFLLIKVKNGSTEEINYRDLGKLSYYIYKDDDEKVDLLKKMTEGHEDVPKFRSKLMLVVKTITKNNFSLLTLSSVILFVIVYFVLFKFMGLNKETSALLFAAFWGPLIYYLQSRKTRALS